jgi:hypothetical protein
MHMPGQLLGCCMVFNKDPRKCVSHAVDSPVLTPSAACVGPALSLQAALGLTPPSSAHKSFASQEASRHTSAASVGVWAWHGSSAAPMSRVDNEERKKADCAQRARRGRAARPQDWGAAHGSRWRGRGCSRGPHHVAMRPARVALKGLATVGCGAYQNSLSNVFIGVSSQGGLALGHPLRKCPKDTDLTQGGFALAAAAAARARNPSRRAAPRVVAVVLGGRACGSLGCWCCVCMSIGMGHE